uniref:Uncharacterized protein n=1 Tax=Daphnia magna TaxID=35525 RepID=A0A0P6FKM3_9CRUS
MATFNELQQVYLEYTHNLLPGTIGLSFPDFCTGYNVFTDIWNDTIPNSPDVHVDEEQHVQLEFTDHDNHVEEEQNLQLGNMANVTPHSHQTIRGPNVLVTRDVEDVAIPVVQVTMDGISPENRRKSCLLAAENRLRQSGPPLPTLWEKITASMDVVSSATAAPLAIEKLKCHRETVLENGKNMVVIRRGQYLVHDFIAKMRTSEFNLHRNKLIDVTFLMQNENGTQTQELGVGVGPLKDLMSTLVEQFVLNRLSTLFNDGTVEPSLYHFTREECNMEMYLAGQVSGLAMVQTFLCPWWTLPFFNRLMDIQKPDSTLHPFLAGLDSQYKVSKILSDPECATLFNRHPLTPEHIMAILNWSEMKLKKNTTLKRAESECQSWFADWLQKLLPDDLSEVLLFLTGSKIIPANWNDHQIKVIFLHLEENEKRRPTIRTCPAFAELKFPVFVTSEEIEEVWIDAVKQVKFGFTFA